MSDMIIGPKVVNKPTSPAPGLSPHKAKLATGTVPLSKIRESSMKPHVGTDMLSLGPGSRLGGVLQSLPDLPSLTGKTTRSLDGGDAVEHRKVVEAAREFEAVFLRYLASAMTQTVSAGGEMEGAHFYKGLIDEQLGDMLAESGRGLGLQESLVRGMSGTDTEDDHAR